MPAEKCISTPPFFCIEGNTGSGKSTLLRALVAKNNHYVALDEPVADAQDVEGINALQLLYENQKRWALTVNLLFYTLHVKNIKNALSKFSDRIIVTDRSLFSGAAFCAADRAAGKFHPLEDIVYRNMTSLSCNSAPKPQGFVYVRTEPEICFDRINKRSRSEELTVPLAYWKKLHEAHEQLFIARSPLIEDIPVLVLDYNEDLNQNEKCVEQALQKIETFMVQTLGVHKASISALDRVIPANGAESISL